MGEGAKDLYDVASSMLSRRGRGKRFGKALLELARGVQKGCSLSGRHTSSSSSPAPLQRA